MSSPPIFGTTRRSRDLRGRIPPPVPPRVSSLIPRPPSERESGGYDFMPGSPSTWKPEHPNFRPSSMYSSNMPTGSCQKVPSSPLTKQPGGYSSVQATNRRESFEQRTATEPIYAQVQPRSERLQLRPNSRGKIPPRPPPRSTSLTSKRTSTIDAFFKDPPPLPPLMEDTEVSQDAPFGIKLRNSRGRIWFPRQAFEGLPTTPLDPQQNYSYSSTPSLGQLDSSGSSWGSDTSQDLDRISIVSEDIRENIGNIPSPSIRTASPSPPPSPTQRPLSELRDSDFPENQESLNPYAKPGPPDPYVGSSVVVGLTKKTFKKFIKDLDAAFVLFYDPCDKNCSWAKMNMREAALVTQRDNHVFAAVDCTKDCKLCKKEGATSIPTMKLYTRGRTLATYYDDTILSSSQMTSLVENTPVLSQKTRYQKMHRADSKPGKENETNGGPASVGVQLTGDKPCRKRVFIYCVRET